MPKVPAKSNVIPMQKPPEEVYIAMAAVQMDRQGKLFEPDPFEIIDFRFPKAGEISAGDVSTAKTDRARLRYYGANESPAKP